MWYYGLGMSFFVTAISLTFLTLLVQYVGLRVRNAALPADERDPHLGRKFALHTFGHFSILLVLAGLTVSVVDILDYVFEPNQNRQFGGPRGQFGPGGFQQPAPPKFEFFNDNQRTAAALILSGLMHFVLFFVILLVATNNSQKRLVARSFVVARLLLAGVITMTATTAFLVGMLQRGDTNYNMLKVVIGFGLVWGPTALVHLLMAVSASDKKQPRYDDRRLPDDDRDAPRRRY